MSKMSKKVVVISSIVLLSLIMGVLSWNNAKYAQGRLLQKTETEMQGHNLKAELKLTGSGSSFDRLTASGSNL